MLTSHCSIIAAYRPYWHSSSGTGRAGDAWLAQPAVRQLALAEDQLGQPRDPQRAIKHAQIGQVQAGLARRLRARPGSASGTSGNHRRISSEKVARSA